STQLDLRRAVATVVANGVVPTASVRALAQTNVFLIQSGVPVFLKPTTATFVPAATTGNTSGVDWVLQQIPGDINGDWAGMQYAVAKASQADYSAIAIVTSVEFAGDVKAQAIALAQQTLTAGAASQIQQHETAWQGFWAGSRLDLADN